jgi:hypothetical protein
MKYAFYDFHGNHLGCMDRTGRLFDADGHEWARLGSDHRVVDSGGQVRGYVNAQGSFFEPDGSCRGYLRDDLARPPANVQPSFAAMQE